MRLVSVICLLALVCTASAVWADKPSDPKPYQMYLAGDRATYPESEPNDTCPGQQMACGDIINPASLVTNDQDWYTFSVAVAGTMLTLGTDVVNAGDNTDTYIELYADNCTTLLAQDDDGGPGWYSLIQNFPAPYAGVYNLKVRGYSGSSIGPYKFFVNCSEPVPPPPNDLCSGAIDIPRCTAGSLNGDTFMANNDYDPGSGGCASGYSEAGKDVVYVMNLQAGDTVDLVYTQLQWDTAFYIVTDCNNVAGSCVAGADDTFTGEPETIHYVAGSTTAYYVILDSYGSGSGGPWTMDYTITCAEPQACCFDDGHCEMLLAGACTQAGGHPQGQGTNCDTVQCEIVPVQNTTWGQIKSNYR